ncbi:hypothetical protein Hbl1158_14680 [Halobaculum sp. CBA1158]|uniref:hypothetical protein n=1 Tax=Halobaculum sp. CBA1158 TaxID=2904243 RepID=UPI001F27B8BA|nr:hypothetical protein [Halobaculum sp. CBA1158]UIO99746.1 hypothetical protein Hbl1158_14680 [Halobaculum sp. CBA1158]
MTTRLQVAAVLALAVVWTASPVAAVGGTALAEPGVDGGVATAETGSAEDAATAETGSAEDAATAEPADPRATPAAVVDSETIEAETADAETAGRLLASRTTTPVGSPVSLGVADASAANESWTLADAPAESDARVYAHGDTATLRPDVAGSYTVGVETEDGTTLTATVRAQGTDRIDLLRRYAPLVSFHENETYYPTRYESFVYNADLEALTAVDDPEPSMFSLAERSDGWELDLDDGDYERYDERYPPTVYGSVHRDVEFRGETYTAVTYWLFYVYDPKQPGSITSLLAHQSDLETVTVLANDSGPQWLAASQHYGGERREWRAVDRVDGHPAVYPALGAHSNYLRDTGAFDGDGIQIQRQFVNETSTDTALFEPAVGIHADRTGDATTWSHDGSVGVDYQLAVLTGDEVWASYEGTVGPEGEGGPVPMARQRWRAPGEWVAGNTAADERQIDARFQSLHFDHARDAAAATVRLGNVGPKPHSFRVRLEAKPVDGGWHEDGRVLNATTLPVGTDATAAATLEGTPPADGRWNVRVRVLAYPESTGGSAESVVVSDPASFTVAVGEGPFGLPLWLRERLREVAAPLALAGVLGALYATLSRFDSS